MSDKDRAEFESWTDSNLILIKHDGKYINPYTETAYSAWQASSERYQPRIAELEAEVVRLKAGNANFPTAPVIVFDRGPWILRDTGQRFTGSDLDEAAFVSYRTAMKGGA